MKKLITLSLAALTLFSVSGATVWKKVNVNGTNRDIKVHLPESMKGGDALVIALHGINKRADWHDSN